MEIQSVKSFLTFLKGGKRIALDAEVVDEETGIIYRYRIETGFKPAEPSAGFPHEAQIKFEE